MTDDVQSDTDTIEATIHERGNGLVDVGDHVAGDDGELYEVVETGRIHCSPSGSGAGNYMSARVRLADWDELSEEEADAMTCTAVIQDEDDEDDDDDDDDDWWDRPGPAMDGIPTTRDEAVYLLVEQDVARWGESEREASARAHAGRSYGRATALS